MNSEPGIAHDRELAGVIARRLYQAEAGVEPISRRDNAVFRLRLPDATVILKLGGSADAALLRKEAMLIGLLGRHGVPVPVIERADLEATCVGRPFLLLADAGQETVADWIVKPPELAGPLLTEMGSVLARIHALTLAGSGDIYHDRIVPRDTAVYRQRLTALAAWCVQQGLLADADAPPFESLPLPALEGARLCHGDFHAVQCIVSQGRISAVVDWESAWAGNPLIDLAVTHAYLDYYCPFELTERFFAGYNALRPLPPDYDRASVPVRMAQALALLRYWQRHGREPSAQRALELYRGYLRRWRERP
jgi:Ser/Thr protein kinase RdoA (MazF antagonist)